jgi:hypothetical protein
METTTDLAAIKAAAEEIKKQLRAHLKQAIDPHGAMTNLAKSAIIDLIEDAMGIFEDYGHTFSPIERMRMNGLGIKNYGFTQTAYENAKRNPQFVPSYLDISSWEDAIKDFQSKREILALIRQFMQQVRDGMRVPADAAYGYALEYYAALQEAAKRKVPGAQSEFAELKPFFKRRRSATAEPTEMELEHDVHALLHGKKDGEIIIRNERPHLVGGKHEVIDETHKERVAAREVKEVSAG